MQNAISIIYHLGAPYTDNDQLTWSLRKSSNTLSQNRVMLRRPKEYRALIAKRIKKLDGAVPSLKDQQALLAAIVKNQTVDRLILSNSKFMGDPAWMLHKGTLFPHAGPKTERLRTLFPENPCEFFLGIRNPASLIPKAFKGQKGRDFDHFVAGVNLLSLRWSDVISRIQQANPGYQITVWCDEDAPVLWPSVLSEITGIYPQTRLAGDLDIIRRVLPEEGADWLERHLEERPQLNETQRQKIRSIFLAKYATPASGEDETDLPDWTGHTVDALSDIYEDDLEVIANMPGVKFLSPMV